MRVLVACEESQAVTVELRRLGHEAYSCDLEPCSGGHPEWHITQDVLPLLNGDCSSETSDFVEHTIIGRWDMILAFPPCTYLTVTGNRWFNEEKYGEKARLRKKYREGAIEFFMQFADADCEHIAIENPVGVMSTIYRKPDYIDSPSNHGDAERKNICLWLKGLSPLSPTNIVEPKLYTYKDGRTDPHWHMSTIGLSPAERSKARSKTFPGLAKAMATQWAGEAETIGKEVTTCKTSYSKSRRKMPCRCSAKSTPKWTSRCTASAATKKTATGWN